MFGIAPIFLSVPLSHDRPQFLNVSKSEDSDYTADEPMIDIKDTYYLTRVMYNDGMATLKSQLISYVGSEEGNISSDVFNNSLKLLSKISPLACNYLIENGLYASNNGTVIFDWEQSNDVFSLEIGKDYLGYFVEKDGVDVVHVDKLSLNEIEFEQTSTQVLSDLARFL